MMKPMANIYEQLRQAILASEKTRYRLWKETGISQGHLCEFMAGTKGLSADGMEKLADCLGWEIIARPKKGKAKTKASSIKANSKNTKEAKAIRKGK